jgi:hypothetical protein
MSIIGQINIDETIESTTGFFLYKSKIDNLFLRIGLKIDNLFLRIGLSSNPNRMVGAIGLDKDHYVAIDYGTTNAGPNITPDNKTVYWNKGIAEIGFSTKFNKIKLGVVLTSKPLTNTLPFNFNMVGLERNGNILSKDGMDVFEIERPWAKDANDQKVWCSYSIDGSQQGSITVPQDFLDNATYPVLIDPTIASINTSIVSGYAMARTSGYVNGYRWCLPGIARVTLTMTLIM